MIMEIRDDGITIVDVKEEQDLLILASAIVEVLQKIPKIGAFVGAAMVGDIDVKEYGIVARTIPLKKDEDPSKAINMLKGFMPAEDKDIPNFVKRSLNGEA